MLGNVFTCQPASGELLLTQLYYSRRWLGHIPQSFFTCETGSPLVPRDSRPVLAFSRRRVMPGHVGTPCLPNIRLHRKHTSVHRAPRGLNPLIPAPAPRAVMHSKPRSTPQRYRNPAVEPVALVAAGGLALRLAQTGAIRAAADSIDRRVSCRVVFEINLHNLRRGRVRGRHANERRSAGGETDGGHGVR